MNRMKKEKEKEEEEEGKNLSNAIETDGEVE